jgi:hypothetical protein
MLAHCALSTGGINGAALREILGVAGGGGDAAPPLLPPPPPSTACNPSTAAQPAANAATVCAPLLRGASATPSLLLLTAELVSGDADAEARSSASRRCDAMRRSRRDGGVVGICEADAPRGFNFSTF